MGITEKCKTSMIEHGLLMRELPDGKEVPAGIELMSKDVIRIALVESDNNGSFPEGFVSEQFLTEFDQGPLYDAINQPAQFSVSEFREITRSAVGYWIDAEIEFVNYAENPDISIFAFKGNGINGVTHYPVNPTTNEPVNIEGSYIGVADAIFSRESAIALAETMGVDMQEEELNRLPTGSQAELTFETLRHEIGNAIGIHDTFDVARGRFDTNIQDDGQCTTEEIAQLSNKDNPGIMNYGANEETWYDTGTRDHLRTNSDNITFKP